jgi:membrane-bound lytic murein transglycosylase B
MAILLIAGTTAKLSVFAQTTEQQVSAREAELRAQLADIEKQIADQQVVLEDKQQETASIARDIAILTAEISKAKLNIQAKNIVIQQLGSDISVKTGTIGDLETKIEEGKQTLGQLLRQTNQIDQVSVVEMILSNKDLSSFFTELDSFDVLKASINNSFVEIREVKQNTELERQDLTRQRDAETDARKVIEAEKRSIEQKESEKNKLLALSKSQEKSYAAVLSDRKAAAAKIRAALFALRDSAAIPFGEALQYANEAFKKTGVRPAFLLAILTQETNLGENIGTCNRPGDPPEKSWKNIMPGPDDNSWRDDQTNFLAITSKLGLDPNSMPLSCPWQNGWGGAMGPSQFIPTTWVAYEDRIARALGKSFANPWDPEDAFMASALYLSDLGAGAGTYTAERTAALKYYAGSNWNKAANAFYGNQVMSHAQDIQENMIDPLQNL